MTTYPLLEQIHIIGRGKGAKNLNESFLSLHQIEKKSISCNIHPFEELIGKQIVSKRHNGMKKKAEIHHSGKKSINEPI
jgi:hypothetical protein